MRAAEGEGEEERRRRPRRREAAEAAADEVAEDEEDNSLLLRGRLIRGRLGLKRKMVFFKTFCCSTQKA